MRKCADVVCLMWITKLDVCDRHTSRSILYQATAYTGSGQTSLYTSTAVHRKTRFLLSRFNTGKNQIAPHYSTELLYSAHFVSPSQDFSKSIFLHIIYSHQRLIEVILTVDQKWCAQQQNYDKMTHSFVHFIQRSLKFNLLQNQGIKISTTI